MMMMMMMQQFDIRSESAWALVGRLEREGKVAVQQVRQSSSDHLALALDVRAHRHGDLVMWLLLLLLLLLGIAIHGHERDDGRQRGCRETCALAIVALARYRSDVGGSSASLLHRRRHVVVVEIGRAHV